jgi:hypothetical protein
LLLLGRGGSRLIWSLLLAAAGCHNDGQPSHEGCRSHRRYASE